jgi:hypothetical protein
MPIALKKKVSNQTPKRPVNCPQTVHIAVSLKLVTPQINYVHLVRFQVPVQLLHLLRAGQGKLWKLRGSVKYTKQFIDKY